jgi:pilus assembly protein CpaE
MPVYFLSTGCSPEQSARVEGRIREVVPALTRITNIEDARFNRSDKPSDPVFVVLLAPASDGDSLNRLLDATAHYREHVFFILISEDISATEYKRLVRTGRADWVSTRAAPQDIIEIIARRRLKREQPPATVPTDARANPVAIAFVPSAGGVGNATLVSEIGVRIKTGKGTKDRRVCVVDLDFQTSHVCDHLDIEPHLQIADISSNPERFDAHLCELFTSRHSSGLDIFAAPRSRLNVADLNVAALDALFDRIAARYDLILIDLPATWFVWTSDILANADGIVVTGINTIPGLRQIAEELTAIRSLRSDASQLAVVINRYEPTLTGGIARRKHVESVLRQEKVFYVRNDAAAMEESINTGTPLVLGNSLRKTVREIGAIATFCAELKSTRAAAT